MSVRGAAHASKAGPLGLPCAAQPNPFMSPHADQSRQGPHSTPCAVGIHPGPCFGTGHLVCMTEANGL